MTAEQQYITSEAAIDLLCELIATPSVSRDESAAATIVFDWLNSHGITANRHNNNVWAVHSHFDHKKPTLMLNAHLDTVKPSPSYTRNPFDATRIDDRIYGLGSNDDGGSVVSLVATFCNLQNAQLPFNLLLALSSEEEVSGENGMRSLLPHLSSLGIKPNMALVGEPTAMQPAIAERGLIVLDGEAKGATGHAARNEGINALYIALDDINTLRNLQFDRTSPTLGDIKVTVTQIEAGRQHNVVPESCRFVVDVRTTDAYTNEQTHEILSAAVKSQLNARSYRIRASVIEENHPMVKAAIEQGKTPFVSPTTSDMALMPDFPTLKMGPGESSRSHQADEYILESEIEQAIDSYADFINRLAKHYSNRGN